MALKIDDATPDSSVGGSELIPVSDASAPKSVTIDNIKDYVIDAIEASTVLASVDGNDFLLVNENGDTLKEVDIDKVAQHAIDTMWGKGAEASPDAADIILLKDGGTTEKTVTAAVLAEYVRATVQAAILDVSDLTVHSTIIAADKFLVTSGTTGKYCTFTVLKDAVLAALLAYVTALDAVTVADDTDVFYVSQGGVQKKCTRAILKVGFGTTIAPSSTTENSIPQWDSASKTLKDGLTLQTTVRATASALDTALPTEQAVREMEATLIFDQTDIGAALADADTILVDDGAVGTTQRKSAISRLWTYVQTKIQALSAKTVPLAADILTIQDTADSNTLKELTIAQLKSYLDSVSLTDDHYRLQWVAGARGKPGVNADILNATESTRMVTDPYFEILGTSAVSADITYNPEGGIIMETVGADGDQDILCPHLDANQSAWTQITWGTDQNVRWECRIRTGANITNCIIWAGLKKTMTEVTITDTDQAFFRYEDDNNDGEWEAVSSIGGSDDEHDTGVVVAINTEYHLVIDIQNDRTALFYINDVLVETSAALTDATDLIPYIGVMADGAAAAKALIVRSQSIRRNFA